MKSKIAFIKRFDSIAGTLAVAVTRRFVISERDSGAVRSILLIRPGGIGDAVLLLPAIRELRNKFPGSGIDILCEKRNAGVFDLQKGIDRIYLYDRGADLLTCIRNKYDVVIDTEQWHRLSAVVAGLTKASLRIGFDTNDRRQMFTHRVAYSHDNYEVYSFLRLLEPLWPDRPEFAADAPFIDPGHVSVLHLLPWPPEKEGAVVAIFPGASVPERRWGGDKFGKVAGALKDNGYRIVVVGSSGDADEAGKIREYEPDSVDLTGRTDLGEAAAVLKRCRLLITADSGLMHLAYAVGTPTVCLFGSGIEKKWAPRGKRHVIINKRFGCSPCTRFGYTPRCRRAAECLSSIGVDEVTEAALRVLGNGLG